MQNWISGYWKQMPECLRKSNTSTSSSILLERILIFPEFNCGLVFFKRMFWINIDLVF